MARRDPGARAAALAGTAVAVVVALGAVATLGGGDGTGVEPREAAEVTASRSAGSPMRAVVGELQAFVERERGLAFKRPVPFQLLDEEAFVRRYRLRSIDSLAAERRKERVYRALGLIRPGDRLRQAQRDLDEVSVLGFYDPRTRRLYVRGEQATPAVRIVLVHELTHALQDQHFNLRRNRTPRGRSPEGPTSVIEGDAVRIESAYVRSLTPEERERADEERRAMGGMPPNTPPALAALRSFPYDYGPPFTAAVVAATGRGGLDAAFGDPPSTTEQVMHPDRFLAGEEARAVDDPPAGGRAFYRDVLGEFMLSLMLAAALPADEAAAAAEGWGGDRYVAWVDGRRTCVRSSIVMDTEADAREMATALRAWAARRTVARVEGVAPVVLTVCA